MNLLQSEISLGTFIRGGEPEEKINKGHIICSHNQECVQKCSNREPSQPLQLRMCTTQNHIKPGER